eukprot:scaffold117407_cov33-Tisochrysis_lutea.AAC.3
MAMDMGASRPPRPPIAHTTHTLGGPAQSSAPAFWHGLSSQHTCPDTHRARAAPRTRTHSSALASHRTDPPLHH